MPTTSTNKIDLPLFDIRFDVTPRSEGVSGASQADTQTPVAYSGIGYTGTPVRSWRGLTIVDLSTLRYKSPLPMFYGHIDGMSPLCVVGRIDQIQNDGKQLTFAGVIYPPANKDDPSGAIIHRARHGHQWQASIGGDGAKWEELEPGEKAVINGRNVVGPMLIARGLELREISTCPVGADGDTNVKIRQTKYTQEQTQMSFEDWVKSLGLDPAALTPEQKAELEKAYAAITNPPTNAEGETTPPEDDDPEETPPMNASGQPGVQLQQYREQIIAEERRVRRIREISVQYGGNVNVRRGTEQVPLVEYAIQAGWDERETELHALRASRPQAPNPVIHGGESTDTVRQAMTASLLMRAGYTHERSAPLLARTQFAARVPDWIRCGVNSPTYGKVFDLAARNYRSLALSDIVREVCRLRGRPVVSIDNEAIRFAFSGGGDLSGIFSDSMYARLTESYLEAEDVTLPLVEETDVANYQDNEDVRLEVASGLTRHPATATAEHMKFKDLVEKYKVDRYSGQIVIDSIDIRNDNLLAFTKLPKLIGDAASRLGPDLVFAQIMSNPTLLATSLNVFHSTNGNALTSSALTLANLKTAVATFRKVQENGVNLNMSPDLLVCPAALEDTAIELTQSRMVVAAGSTDLQRGADNAMVRYGIKTISDARLDNGLTNPETGLTISGSATTWYLATSKRPTMVRAYLSGSGRVPTPTPFDLTEGRLGMGWLIEHNVGVRFLGWRGIQRQVA